jgi:hyperosmotically inducible protein
MALLSGATAGLLFGNGGLLASDSDDKIEAAAKSSYVFKTYLADDSVKLDAKDGRVTLTGSVRNESHKLLAQETVAGLPGVTGVENQIQLKDQQPENSDTWLALKVKAALAFHRGVSAYSTEVKVNEGVVTLKGDASSEAQRELTKVYAEDIDGVKGVVNEMKVAPEKAKHTKTSEESVDDASINAQVRVALLTHRSTRASRISVSTHDGVVTLKGTAKNEAEKTLVSKLVNDIHGVKEIVNKIEVRAQSLDN